MSQVLRWCRLPAEFFFKGVDDRFYAIIRIAFATVALLNLAFLWPHRLVFFADTGLFEQSVVARQASPVYLSIFSLVSSEAGVTALFLVSALAMLMLLLGVAARWAAFWVLIWHISYLARSPLLFGGWDLILRAFAFLVFISPLGACWTLASVTRKGPWLPPELSPRHGLILMRLQTTVIYWHAMLVRFDSGDAYWKNGEFLSYFMLSHYSRWAGHWVLDAGAILALATYAVQVAEIALPVLLWIGKTRWWGIGLGAALHIGICLAAKDLGMFCLTMLMTYLAFLRKEDLEMFARWWRQLRPAVGREPV